MTNNEQRKAKIIYHEFNSQFNDEGYEIRIYSQEIHAYEFATFYPLVRREFCNENEEKNFVHFSLINKIRELSSLGYKIIWEC